MRRKTAIIILVGVLGAGLFVPLALQTVARERASRAYNRDNLIRLHIVANSNEPGDQELKFRVRDAIIRALRQELLRLHSRGEAEAFLESDRPQITRIAEETIAESGYSYPVHLEIGNYAFPARAYGDLALPAGNYRALRIVLGKGSGANWWCVLYPPLCFVDATGSGIAAGDAGKEIESLAGSKDTGKAPAVQDQINPAVNGGGVRLRLRVLDWLEHESSLAARLLNP